MGGTDIENVDPRNLGPVIMRPGPGITSRMIHFNAATSSIQGAATIEEVIAGTPTEELKEGTDLIDDTTVRTSPSQARSPHPSIVPPATSNSPTSSVPFRGTRAYNHTTDLAAMHQAILTIEDNTNNDDMLGLAELNSKNKRCRR